MATTKGAVTIDAGLVAQVAADIDAQTVGERIGAHAIDAIRELIDRGDADLEQETVRAAASNVHAVLRGITRGEDPSRAEPPEVTLSWVSTLVHRGFGASVIPRCYTVGQAILDLALRDAIAARDLAPEQQWQLAERASQYLFGFVEKITGDLLDHYERERDRWVRGADSIRTELVLEMVEGRPFDPAAASATLRYELDRPHLALLIWSDAAEAARGSSPAVLKQAAADLARAFGGTDLLTLPAGSSALWAWCSGPGLTETPAATLGLEPTVMAAAGSIGQGATGFVHSHREARDARRAGELLGRRPGTVTRFQSVALVALLTRDREAAGRFLERELGALAANTDTCRRLRATVAVFFEEGGSWGRAAERLGIHQNTVIYRARRAEELLGRPLSERRLELEAALRLAEARERLQSAPAG